MTAQRLRDAARGMREKAEGATCGPWTYETAANGFAPLVVGDNMAIAETFDKPHLRDAAYIAAMHPAVALAVADWLDAEVAAWEYRENSLGAISVRAMSGGTNDVNPHALAVADAFLGQAEGATW